jgi:hypothetical protein
MGKVSNSQTRAGLDFISRLPPEILQLIFLNLSPRNLIACERVSKLFYQQARDEAIWGKKIKDYHIVCSCNASARLALLRFFKPKPLPKPARERQTYFYNFRTDFLI